MFPTFTIKKTPKCRYTNIPFPWILWGPMFLILTTSRTVSSLFNFTSINSTGKPGFQITLNWGGLGTDFWEDFYAICLASKSEKFSGLKFQVFQWVILVFHAQNFKKNSPPWGFPLKRHSFCTSASPWGWQVHWLSKSAKVIARLWGLRSAW